MVVVRAATERRARRLAVLSFGAATEWALTFPSMAPGTIPRSCGRGRWTSRAIRPRVARPCLSRSATATSDQAAAGRIPPAWVVPLLLSAAVALVYTLGLDRPPHPDEL